MKLKLLVIISLLVSCVNTQAARCTNPNAKSLNSIKSEKFRISSELRQAEERYQELHQINYEFNRAAYTGSISSFIAGGSMGALVILPSFLTAAVATTTTALGWVAVFTGFASSAVQTIGGDLRHFVERQFSDKNVARLEAYLVIANTMLEGKIVCNSSDTDYYTLISEIDHAISEVYLIGDFDVSFIDRVFLAKKERLTVQVLTRLSAVKVKILEQILLDVEIKDDLVSMPN